MKSEECTFRFRASGDEHHECSRAHGTLYCKRDNCPRPSIDWPEPEPEVDAGVRAAVEAIRGAPPAQGWDVLTVLGDLDLVARRAVSCVMGLQAEVHAATEQNKTLIVAVLNLEAKLAAPSPPEPCNCEQSGRLEREVERLKLRDIIPLSPYREGIYSEMEALESEAEKATTEFRRLLEARNDLAGALGMLPGDSVAGSAMIDCAQSLRATVARQRGLLEDIEKRMPPTVLGGLMVAVRRELAEEKP